MSQPVRITDSIFHIGDRTTHLGLDCNPYLLIDGNEAVLFDPGSPTDFDQVMAHVESLIPLEQVKYVVLHHEDPDFCSALPLLEARGLQAQLVTSWRTMTLIQYYRLQSPYYLLEEHEWKLTLASGRELVFIPTPYLHFAGAFATYDRREKALFSSDLFGAFSYNHSLFADETYLDQMLTFHEHYMPSNTVLRPVMDLLLTYDLRLILPQHGSIIQQNIPEYIHALRSLECGTMLNPIRKDLMESGGMRTVFNEVLGRYRAVHSPDEVLATFQSLGRFALDDEKGITDYSQNSTEIWESLFQHIRQERGVLWLTVIEPFIRTLAATYGLPVPSAFLNAIEQADAENRRLSDLNQQLDQRIHSIESRLFKCPVTGLFNETFMTNLFIEELSTEDWRDVGSLLFIGIDDYSKFRLRYGEEEHLNTLSGMAYILKEAFGSQGVFRPNDADFGVYVKGYGKDALTALADQLRLQIASSDVFIAPLTVSIGICFPEELELDAVTYEHAVSRYIEKGYQRLRKAKIMGKNVVCASGELEEEQVNPPGILIADTDPVNLEVLKAFIEREGAQVFTATDGQEALALAQRHLPSLIIAETFLPKLDGFLLRETLLNHSETKAIPMIFLSYRKDEDAVMRALTLGITYFIKKPYLLSEVVGIVNKHLKG